MRYRQLHEDGWCEVDSTDEYGPVVAVEIELEDDEVLTAPLAQLRQAGEKYTIELAQMRYAGRHGGPGS